MHSTRRPQSLREERFRDPERTQAGAGIEVIRVVRGNAKPSAPRACVMPRVDHPARERVEAALRLGGYANYGGDWQCPACRCRVADERHVDLSLRMKLDGDSVRLRCEHGCRENTIRAMLGMAAYVDDSPHLPESRGSDPRH